MALIGLTGGIGAGKSTVARRLASHGAIVIDADHIAREVVEPGTKALTLISEAFGHDVVNQDGTLNRAVLGSIIFNDDSARLKLNSIVHPAVRQRSLELITSQEPGSVIVYDVPLLVETENSYDFDKIIVVTADPQLRIQRLMDLRGMTEHEAQSRVYSQATEEERLAIADYVIDTSGSLEKTYMDVDELWAVIQNVD